MELGPRTLVTAWSDCRCKLVPDLANSNDVAIIAPTAIVIANV